MTPTTFAPALTPNGSGLFGPGVTYTPLLEDINEAGITAVVVYHPITLPPRRAAGIAGDFLAWHATAPTGAHGVYTSDPDNPDAELLRAVGPFPDGSVHVMFTDQVVWDDDPDPRPEPGHSRPLNTDGDPSR